MFNYHSFPPVHCSKKEVRRLLGAGYSYREIGVTLGVSTAHAHRINNGYRCRCGACPRARSRRKLVELAEAPQSKKPVRIRRPRGNQEDGGWLQKGLNIATQALVLLQAWKDLKGQNGKESPRPGW